MVSLLASPPAMLAWQATPVAGGRPAAPRCAATPVSPAQIAAIVTVAAPDDPAAANPQGEAVPPAERGPLGDLVGRWSVCLASGNLPALLGLFTADGIRRLLADPAPFLGGPAGLTVSVLSVGDVVRLGDGRVAGRVTVDPSGNGSSAPVSLLMIVAKANGGWRIDHLNSQSPDAASAPSRALLRRPIAPGAGVPVPVPGPTVAMRGGDMARSGAQAGPAPAASPVTRWQAPTGWQSTAQPVVANGLVLFGGFSLGDRRSLLAGVDAASGGVRWQTTAPVVMAQFPDTPAFNGDALFAPVEGPVAGVLAVVAGTGQPLWFAPFGFTSLTAPAVDTDLVYVAGWTPRNPRDRSRGDVTGAVFALDQRTGRQRWRFLAPARFGPLAVGRDAVFVPSNHGLYALDRATGRKRWQARFSPGPNGTPTVVGSLVVFTGSEITSGKAGVFALDAASGALRWRVDLPAVAGARAGSAATERTLYVTWCDPVAGQSGVGAPTLRAYDLATGKERWVFEVRADAGAPEGASVGSVTAPAIVGDLVLFGVAISDRAADANGLYAVNAESGALRWHAAAATPIGSAPAVLGGSVYAMSGPGPQSDDASGTLLAFGAR